MTRNVAWLLAAACILFSLSGPKAVLAEDLNVDNRGGGGFTTIQAAIEHARLRRNEGTTFVIRVKSSPTPYRGPITPIGNVPIIGENTADTVIAGGSPTLIDLSNISDGLTIRNFTFRSATTAISIAGSSLIDITNCVFDLGTTGTAIRVLNSPSTRIINNTFFANGTAISTNSDIEITNNIFANNTLAIDDQTTLTKLSFSDFFDNGNNGVDLGNDSIPNNRVLDANPRFVNLARQDFRLQEDSPAKGSGNPRFANSFDPSSSDMGAYGGPFSDRSVSTITGVTTEERPSNSIGVSWNPTSNNSVNGYRVYFGTSPRNVAVYPDSRLVPVPDTSTVLSALPVTTPPIPGTPSHVTLTSLNQALQVNWNPVEGATGYRVYFRPGASFDQATLDSASVQNVAGGSTTSTVIPNLINGTTYFVAVAARAQAQIFIAVTAVIDTGAISSPGSANESPFSDEVVQGVGGVESPISDLASDFPEAVSPFPNLSGEGCFIATAAYGFYSAPQVQVLRRFRDHYLMSNGPGRAFVEWYYRYGPRGARFINDHPWLKPPVRLALLPLIALALFLTGTTPLAKVAILALVILVSAYLLQKIRKTQPSREEQAGANPRVELKKLLPAAVVMLLAGLPGAAEAATERPHWSFELKGGVVFPEADQWSRFYGTSYLGEYGAALSYKVLRQVEIGVEGSYAKGTGRGQQPLHEQAAGGTLDGTGEVSYQQVPLNLFVLARGVFYEEQWLVPYAGAGYTRFFYRQRVKGQEKTEGSVNGYHARAGVQLLLDRLEPESAENALLDFGVHNTYLFVEGRYLNAEVDTVPSGSVNLGGTSALGGFLVEF